MFKRSFGWYSMIIPRQSGTLALTEGIIQHQKLIFKIFQINRMKKIKFYKISYSIDPQITGQLPRHSDSQINGFIDPENNSVERTDQYQYKGLTYIPEGIDMHKFKADHNAKITDLMSSLFFASQGFFVSNKFNEILKSLITSNIRAYGATVFFHESPLDYYFLDFTRTSDIVDFNRSTFVADHSAPAMRSGGEKVSVLSFEDYKEKGRLLRKEQGFAFELIPVTLALNYPSDMLQFPFSGLKYVSEKLRQKIEEEKLTGIVFEETDIEFFCCFQNY